MIESLVIAFVIYFVIVDPIGNAAIFLVVNVAQARTRQIPAILEGALVAIMIILLFAVSGA